MSRDMKTAAGALGGKTARACDSCLRRRARWFCGADDAFLCHSCDNLVHSANQLASRHERVRLQSASNKVAAWHSGFTRKARTPRHGSHHKQAALQQRLKDQVLFNNNTSVLPVVPELGSEEGVLDDHEEILCRVVPVFDPFDAHLSSNTNELESFSEFLSAEFAADVESLLEHDSFSEMKAQGEGARNDEAMVIKVKDEEELDDYTSVFEMASEDAFDWNIESVLGAAEASNNNNDGVAGDDDVGRKKEMLLRLNYEDVITAWASQGCPWTTGNPPKFNSDDDTWPNCLEWNNYNSPDAHCCSSSYVEATSIRGHLIGREARVSRYREKRRTRLFAKKIRYEVRKLNAEKRPRMKGRFVKRACLVGATH